MYIYIFILAVAVVYDFETGHIPNPLSVGGILISQAIVAVNESVASAVFGLLGMLLVILFLFPIFMIGGIGAGDIKLLMIAPMFFTKRETVGIILTSLVIGALFGALKLVRKHMLRIRLINFIQYIESGLLNRHLYIYDYFESNQNNSFKTHRIHLSLSILISVMIFARGRLFT